MEALTTSTTTTTTTGAAVSLPNFSAGKSKDHPSRRLRLFSTSPKNENNNSSNGDNSLKSDSNDSALVPILSNRTLSKDAAMGLVLSAANVRGWTTGSGMEGPPVPAGSDADSGATGQVSTFPWSLFTKSPRRRMRVAFTCNVCGQRTTRAINPHAYTDGTVFVQCCGCNIFHKLVDNLNLFHEMKCYVNSSFNPNPNGDVGFNYFDLDKDNDDGGPASSKASTARVAASPAAIPKLAVNASLKDFGLAVDATAASAVLASNAMAIEIILGGEDGSPAFLPYTVKVSSGERL